MKTFLTVLICSISLQVIGQNTDIPKEFKNSKEIVLNRIIRLKINKQNQKLKIKQDFKQTILQQKEQNHHRKDRIYYSNTFHKLTKVKAFTNNNYNNFKNPSNNSFVWDVTNFTDTDVVSSYIFYDDQKAKEFIYNGVKPGSLKNLLYTKEYFKPELIPSLTAMDRFPILELTYQVEHDIDIAIDIRKFNFENVTVKDSTFLKDKKTVVHQWKFKNLPSFDRTSNFSPLYYAPTIHPKISSYKDLNDKIKILGNDKDLYNWLYKCLVKTDNSYNEEIYNKAKELTKDINNPVAKIKKIFNYVQNNIHYIAFEDGMNGYIPRNAKQIDTNKYGDCKDMANLLTCMLQGIGIEAYHTWVGSRRIPYEVNEIATPRVFNHMICAVKIENNFLFLDPTDSFTEYGYPSSFIQGKEALIGISDNDFLIKKIPEVHSSKNFVTNSFNLTLDDNLSIKGKFNSTHKGLEKSKIISKLNYRDNKKHDYLNSVLSFKNNHVVLSNQEIQGNNNRDSILTVNCNVKFINSVRKLGNKIILKTDFDNRFDYQELDNINSFGYKIDNKLLQENNFNITIPENYEVSYLPKKFQNENNNFSISIDYKLIENNIQIKRTVAIKKLSAKKDEIKDWNNFIYQIKKQDANSIIIKRKTL